MLVKGDFAALTAQNERASAGKRPSIRKLVNLMCKSCVYDPSDPGTWRAQVQACTCDLCPLHAIRPTATVAPQQ